MKPTETMTGADAVVRLLQGHGVTHIFGLCGDTSLPFYDSLHRLDHGMRHVLTRDERSAAYMADAYARVTGKVGVCEGPSGGGATYILPGLVEANESSIPILAINTDISVGSRGHYALTELDQEALFRPVTKWNRVIDRPDQIPSVFRGAFRAATTGRPGAVHIGLPFDVQKGAVEHSDVWADERFGAFPALRAGPDPDGVEEAAALIRKASRPFVVVGGGVAVSGAYRELQAFVERIGAPIATSISGKGSISELHPQSVGVVGSNGGSPHVSRLLDEADLVIFIGCRAGSVTTERWRHPAVGRARILHIDADPAVIDANYRADAALVGDARLVLAALTDRLDAADPKAVERAAADAAKVREARAAQFAPLAASSETPIRPERLIAELQSLLPPESIIVADPGTPCPYVSAHYRLVQPGRGYITNRAHGALGYSMAASVGAAIGRPDKKVVAIMGDGSFGFTAGELETIVRHRVPVTMIVVSNSVYGWIKAGQKSGFGERYFSVDFSRTDHARVAEAFGVRAWRAEDPDGLRAVLKAALEHDGPTLVDVIAQPLQDAAAPVTEWVA